MSIIGINIKRDVGAIIQTVMLHRIKGFIDSIRVIVVVVIDIIGLNLESINE